jgi:hypothetical protein
VTFPSKDIYGAWMVMHLPTYYVYCTYFTHDTFHTRSHFRSRAEKGGSERVAVGSTEWAAARDGPRRIVQLSWLGTCVLHLKPYQMG